MFATLNSPGALAPLLGLSLLCYLTVRPQRAAVAVAGAAVLTVAISLTFVRSAWVALIVAALAHVIASRGRSARLVLRHGRGDVAATLALAPVSTTARDVSTASRRSANLAGHGPRRPLGDLLRDAAQGAQAPWDTVSAARASHRS